MRILWPLVVAALISTACTLPEPPPPRNCDERTAFYPDADGDGLGETTDVYVGCEAPDGWVTNADDVEDPDTDTNADTDTDTDTDTESGGN